MYTEQNFKKILQGVVELKKAQIYADVPIFCVLFIILPIIEIESRNKSEKKVIIMKIYADCRCPYILCTFYPSYNRNRTKEQKREEGYHYDISSTIGGVSHTNKISRQIFFVSYMLF